MSPFPAPARSNCACGFPGRVGHRRGAGGQRGVAVTGPSSGCECRCLIRASVRFLRPPPSSRTAGFPQSGWRREHVPPRPSQTRHRLTPWRACPGAVVGLSRSSPSPTVSADAGRIYHAAPAAPRFPAVPAQGPFAPGALPPFIAHMGPCADPDAPRRHFSFSLIGGALAACAIHGRSSGPSRLYLLFYPGVLRPLPRRLVRCT